MKKTLLLCGLLAGWTHAVIAADPVLTGDAVAGKDKSMTCSACHSADGNSVVPTFPKLAGQGEKYLVKQMKDIRDGARPVPTMAGQVDNMSNQDLADIAAYYASQRYRERRLIPHWSNWERKCTELVSLSVALRHVSLVTRPMVMATPPPGFLHFPVSMQSTLQLS